MNNEPKWLKDLRSRVDSVEFGQIQVTIQRAANKTTKIETPGFETLKPPSNQDAVKTMLYMIGEYQDKELTGNLSLVISFRKGKIELVAVQTNRVEQYE